MENRRVQLKTKPGEDEYFGYIDKLYLPADINKFRKFDLWRVRWDNGKTGIVEIKDINFIQDENTDSSR